MAFKPHSRPQHIGRCAVATDLRKILYGYHVSYSHYRRNRWGLLVVDRFIHTFSFTEQRAMARQYVEEFGLTEPGGEPGDEQLMMRFKEYLAEARRADPDGFRRAQTRPGYYGKGMGLQSMGAAYRAYVDCKKRYEKARMVLADPQRFLDLKREKSREYKRRSEERKRRRQKRAPRVAKVGS